MKFQNLCLFALFIGFIFCLNIADSWSAAVTPDDFNGPNISENFKWQNEPNTWDVGKTTKGWLRMEGVFGGNLWCSDLSARLFQEIKDEPFEIETRMKVQWGNNASEVAGIIVKSPKDDNWIKIKLWTHLDKTAQIQFQKKCLEAGDGLTGNVVDYKPTTGVSDLWLKLKRDGDKCVASYKTAENENWKEIGTTSFPFTAPYEVGIFGAVDNGAGNLIVEFDYFKDNTSSIKLAVTSQTKLVSLWGNIKNGR
jgi:regulation of enolase protein 1 (concanavalin A-like superfamily)